MYYYIYRISKNLKNKLLILNKEDLNDLTSDLTFYSFDNYIIKGVVNLEDDSLVGKNIHFEIDLIYLFLFIETNHQKILNKCINIIEPFFNDNIGGELENFLPRISKEHELICSAEKYNLKFFYNGEIIDSDDDESIEEKYCASKLDNSYILIEADILLENNVSFYYYRKSLQIDNESIKNKVFDKFKKVMA